MRRLLLWWLTVALIGVTSVASAQSDPGRDAEARGLFEAGRAAFDQGRYQDALGYFDRAYQLSRRPQLLYNIGQVHDRLRHDDEALQAFTQYLKQVPSAQNRDEVEHRMQALRQAMIGTLHFTITPAGAHVWIDGNAQAIDASGRVQVSTGSHEIVVRAEGYAELRQRMNVRGGDVIELPVALQPSDGQLSITPASVTTRPTEPSTTTEPASPTTTSPEATQVAPAIEMHSTQQPVAPAPSGGSALSTVGLVSVVAGGVFIAGGGVFALLGSSEFDDLNDECSKVCGDDEIENRGNSIETKALLTNVGLIGGGALVGVGVLLMVIGGSSRSDHPPASAAPPALVVGPTSIMLQGSF